MSVVVPALELKTRLEQFRSRLEDSRLRGALITDPVNVHYLSGFRGDDSALLVTLTRRWLLTDFRYIEEAGHTARGWRVVLRPPGLFEMAGHWIRRLGLRRVGVEPEHLTWGQLSLLRRSARGVRVRAVPGLVAELRLRKSPWEVRQIERALRIQEDCFRQWVRRLRPGLEERDAAAELRYRLVRTGAEDEAFPSICLWDPDASLPHGHPGPRRLRADSLVLLDWGARYAGYHSDLTRTFFLGNIPARLRRIHEVVAEAQARARERVAPGVPFAEVDKAARSFIARAGYGRQFGHSTGHGVGLRIHERPRLSARAEGELQPGMVVTVEPGIYLPGVGGVRIEDDVLVTERGHRVLSRLPVGLRHGGDHERTGARA